MGIDPSAPAYWDIDRANARIHRQGHHDITDKLLAHEPGIYAVAPAVPDTSVGYLTARKPYKVLSEGGGMFHFKDDNGNTKAATWTDSSHLDNGRWVRVFVPSEAITGKTEQMVIHDELALLPDAVSGWDVERQEQVMLNTFDNTDCEDCEGECSVNWIEVSE